MFRGLGPISPVKRFKAAVSWVMGDSFLKALRWFLFVVFVIGGIAAIVAVEKHGVQPLMLAVFSFGGAYLMSGPWRELPREAMIASILAVAGLAWLADQLPEILYVYQGILLDMNFYFIWIGLVFGIGVPLMTFMFYKYGE